MRFSMLQHGRVVMESSVRCQERVTKRSKSGPHQRTCRPDLGMAGADKEDDVEVEGLEDRIGRLSALLGFSRTPPREGLLKEAVRKLSLFSLMHLLINLLVKS